MAQSRAYQLKKTMAKFDLISLPTPEAVATEVARRWLSELSHHNQNQHRQYVALSGGRISGTFFDQVVSQSHEQNVDFQQVHFFWADERCVPPDNRESNFATAHQRLLTPLQINLAQIHRVHGELNPQQAAAHAEVELRQVVLPETPSGPPQLNLVFLGMGEDGHVASLFPEEPESEGHGPEIYRAVTASKPPPQRVTLSYAPLWQADQVWVMASGEGKREALAHSLTPDGNTPLAHVIRHRQKTVIFTDIDL